MKTVGRSWRRPDRVHPVWCDVVRCQSDYASTIGEHRSKPMSAVAAGYGSIVLTLTQRPGWRAQLEVTVSAEVPEAGGGARERVYAEQLLQELAATVTRVGVHARADAILSAPARRELI